MTKNLEITDTYEPNSNLQKQLENLPEMGGVTVVQTKQLELVNGESALQIISEGIFAGERVTRADAKTPFGVISSYQRDLALAATMILVDSLEFGEPAIAYEIHSESGQEGPEYPQLIAEWHHHTPAARTSENGSIGQPDCGDTERVSLEALEARAERWFASH